LSGGVNIMLVPEFPLCMSKGHFLAPDGHSKSFDERADGYARGEGCGIVVLKPLSAALRDEDDIYAREGCEVGDGVARIAAAATTARIIRCVTDIPPVRAS
jgi:3-oxoacyl-(acyl-carrier-protein) synthase